MESLGALIDGEVTGWSRGTRFRLDNGQVWEVREDRSYHMPRPVENPRIEIQRAAMGSYRMQVEGVNPRPRVRRVR
jgi:hypothetical protein